MMKLLTGIFVLLLLTTLSFVQAEKEHRLRGGRQEDIRVEQTKRRTKQRQDARRIAAQAGTRIIGGEDAPAGKYPYIAEFELGCGGSLIAPDMLLTVAHCYELIRGSDYAYVGSNELREGRRREMVRLIKHPDYVPETSQYDFMLVQLSRPLPPTYEPVALNERFETPGLVTVSKENGRQGENNNNEGVGRVGELLTVLGFGVQREGDSYMSPWLQQANVPYIPQEVCQEWYHDELVDEKCMFCAGYRNGGVDSCQGDSGSPILNDEGVQVGVVSWGQGCARRKSPGVYGRVSAVHGWIKETVCEFATVKPNYCFVQGPSSGTSSHSGTIISGSGSGGSSSGSGSTSSGSDSGGFSSGGGWNDGSGSGSGGGSSSGGSSSTSSNSDVVIPSPPNLVVSAQEKGHTIELDIKYDGNPNQVAWILVKTDTDKIIDFVAYGDAKTPFEQVTLTYEGLESGEYTFLVTDSANNGICCAAGHGSIMINEILPDKSSKLLWLSSGGYGAGTVQRFELEPPTLEPAPSTP